jgi:hypothetical protein
MSRTLATTILSAIVPASAMGTNAFFFQIGRISTQRNTIPGTSATHQNRFQVHVIQNSQDVAITY